VALVGQHGFDAVTVDDIADAAAVSRRTFFNHFPTKAAALFDPAPEDAERLSALLEAVPATSDVWSALRQVCVPFVAGHEDVIGVRRRLIAQSPDLDQYHRTAHRHVELRLHHWTDHRLPDDPFLAALAAQTASAVMISAFHTWQPDDSPALLPHLVERGFAAVSLTAPATGEPFRSIEFLA